MKRNMDLVRALLLNLEPFDPWNDPPLEMGKGPLNIEGVSVHEVHYHLLLMMDGGLLTDTIASIDGKITTFRGLTWQGAELLDTIRDPEAWTNIKAGAKAAGVGSVSIILEFAKAYAKVKLFEKTGISL